MIYRHAKQYILYSLVCDSLNRNLLTIQTIILYVRFIYVTYKIHIHMFTFFTVFIHMFTRKSLAGSHYIFLYTFVRETQQLDFFPPFSIYFMNFTTVFYKYSMYVREFHQLDLEQISLDIRPPPRKQLRYNGAWDFDINQYFSLTTVLCFMRIKKIHGTLPKSIFFTYITILYMGLVKPFDFSHDLNTNIFWLQ